MLISVVKSSGDQKLSANGKMAASWISQVSCHSDCPLKSNGCYAETGNAGIHTHRLNARVKQQKSSVAKMRRLLARQEAAAIDNLPADVKLRVHVVGDSATAQAAGTVGRAMVRYQQRGGQSAYTYTHSWRAVRHASWAGATVLASVEQSADVPKAHARGYQVALVVPPHPTNKVYEYQGVKVLPCPAQFYRVHGEVKPATRLSPADRAGEKQRLTTCEKCTVCQRPEVLKSRGLVVGFEPDANSTKRVMKLITVKREC